MKIVNIAEACAGYGRKPGAWKWLQHRVDPSVEWTHLCADACGRFLDGLAMPRLSRYWTALKGVWQARHADLLVSHGTEMAAAVALFQRFLGGSAVHIAWSFNLPHPERMTGLRRAYYHFALAHVDRLVMFSTLETRLYPKLLNLPAERFEMVRWTASEPEYDRTAPAPIEGDYIAAIGGEGRDYATLFEAMRRLPDLRLLVVASPASVEGLTPPENVDLRINVPIQETYLLAAHSSFMVLPLLTRETPCGHGSLVSQFALGKATIVTDSEGMTDYIRPGENALVCPPEDAEALAAAIRRLADDDALRNQIAEAGRQFALNECDETRTVEYLEQWLSPDRLVTR